MKEDEDEEEKKNIRPNIFITDESSIELVYTDLLDSIIPFFILVSELEGNWREHLKLL